LCHGQGNTPAARAAKWFSDWYQHKSTMERERENRIAARREQLTERRAEFQRQTLLDLQDALFDLMRTTGAMHHQDEMAYRQTGEWQKRLFGDELYDKSQVAMRRTAMFQVRVRDASLREMADDLRKLSAQVTVGTSKSESDSAMLDAADLFVQVQERIGEILRTLDDEEAAPLETTKP